MYTKVNGIPAISILTKVLYGNLNLKPGRTITIVNTKYITFAVNVAIPTPVTPYWGIKIIFSITPITPDTNFIMKLRC